MSDDFKKTLEQFHYNATPHIIELNRLVSLLKKDFRITIDAKDSDVIFKRQTDQKCDPPLIGGFKVCGKNLQRWHVLWEVFQDIFSDVDPTITGFFSHMIESIWRYSFSFEGQLLHTHKFTDYSSYGGVMNPSNCHFYFAQNGLICKKTSLRSDPVVLFNLRNNSGFNNIHRIYVHNQTETLFISDRASCVNAYDVSGNEKFDKNITGKWKNVLSVSVVGDTVWMLFGEKKATIIRVYNIFTGKFIKRILVSRYGKSHYSLDERRLITTNDTVFSVTNRRSDDNFCMMFTRRDPTYFSLLHDAEKIEPTHDPIHIYGLPYNLQFDSELIDALKKSKLLCCFNNYYEYDGLFYVTDDQKIYVLC